MNMKKFFTCTAAVAGVALFSVSAFAEEAGGTPSLSIFGDAYAGVQTTESGEGPGGNIYALTDGENAQNGFGINWLGLDAAYDGGAWGVTGSLRFGDAVAIYGTGSLGPVTQAYVTWRPSDKLTLDLGTFGTIYGAEVAENWANLNYTRGALYFNLQPFWHTGLRAEYADGDWVARALVVNDANTSLLGTSALNLGLQGGYDNGAFGIVAGVLQSTKPELAGFVDTFVDVVVTANAGDLSIIGNFDFNAGTDTAAFVGGSLAAGYSFSPTFGAAVRGEFISVEAGEDEDDNTRFTATLTLDFKPTGSDNFMIRWDNRVESANTDAFGAGDDATSTWFGSTLGFVAYADLL